MPIKDFFIYLLIIAGSTYLIRVIPFVLVRDKIKNEFINSFLYYIPYTVLTAMTFPAAIYVTGHLVSGIIGFLTAILVSIKIQNATIVAISSSVSVFIIEIIIWLL